MEKSRSSTSSGSRFTTKNAVLITALLVGFAFMASLQPSTMLHSKYDFIFGFIGPLIIAIVDFVLLLACLTGTNQCLLPVANAPIEIRQKHLEINTIVLRKAMLFSALPLIAIVFHPLFFLFNIGVLFLLPVCAILLVFSTSFFMSSELKKRHYLINNIRSLDTSEKTIYDKFPGSELFYSPASPLYSMWDRYRT